MPRNESFFIHTCCWLLGSVLKTCPSRSSSASSTAFVCVSADGVLTIFHSLVSCRSRWKCREEGVLAMEDPHVVYCLLVVWITCLLYGVLCRDCCQCLLAARLTPYVTPYSSRLRQLLLIRDLGPGLAQFCRFPSSLLCTSNTPSLSRCGFFSSASVSAPKRSRRSGGCPERTNHRRRMLEPITQSGEGSVFFLDVIMYVPLTASPPLRRICV